MTALFRRSLLLILFLVLVVRLAGFVVVFGKTSLQMDLAAFYTAGQAVSRGWSPYVNHVDREPPLWDGVATFVHSRFLYPPLAARLFQPLTLAPYARVKVLWMILSLAALSAGLWLAMRIARLERTPENLLTVGIVASAAYPTLTLLERGQIDALALLLIVAAVALMAAPRGSAAGGALLAVAALVKLNAAFLFPFLLIRRDWRAATAFVTAGLGLVGLGLLIDGRAPLLDYALHELPRIARYGEGGTREMRLPDEAFRRVLQGAEPGNTVMDGREYKPAYARFVLNATIAQGPVGDALRNAAGRLGFALDPPRLALLLLAAGVVLLLAWQWRYRLPTGAERGLWDLVYWQLALALILLCGPVTWAMTTVWLLPLVVVVLREVRRLASAGHALAVLVCLAALGLAAAPDPYGNALLLPFGRPFVDLKYIAAELLAVLGLLGLWRHASGSTR